jgi:hypothetical protein
MKKAAIIPIVILLFVVLAYATTNVYRVPTADIRFTEQRPADVKTVVYEVAGLKCRGTSDLFAQQISGVPGVVSFLAYARTHTAVVEYDPTLTTPDAIREAFERPIVQQGQSYDVFKAVSQELR